MVGILHTRICALPFVPFEWFPTLGLDPPSLQTGNAICVGLGDEHSVISARHAFVGIDLIITGSTLYNGM